MAIDRSVFGVGLRVRLDFRPDTSLVFFLLEWTGRYELRSLFSHYCIHRTGSILAGSNLDELGSKKGFAGPTRIPVAVDLLLRWFGNGRIRDSTTSEASICWLKSNLSGNPTNRDLTPYQKTRYSFFCRQSRLSRRLSADLAQ